jgi:hypothetical protein
MDAAFFADLLRAFVSPVLSRRATLVTALSSLLGSPSLALIGNGAVARKKHKRRNHRRSCKKGTKKCRKKCIAVTACCTSTACGNGGTCISGRCNCPSGFHDCGGSCEPLGRDGCCGASDCAGTQICDDGNCVCPGASEFRCGSDCCDAAADEVCQQIGNDLVCRPGGCPTNDICITEDGIGCGQGCFCATTIDFMATNACVENTSIHEPASCTPCTSSADCGAGKVCIGGNDFFCGCDNNFCVSLCAADAPRRRS